MEFKDLLPDIDQQMLVVGMKGAGKTTFIKNLIRTISKKELVIIIDSKPEWDNLTGMFSTGEYHKLNVKFLPLLNRKDSTGIYVYQCNDEKKAFADENVDKIVRWAIRRGMKKRKEKKPNVTIVFDEFGDFTRGPSTSYMVEKLLRQSRSKNIRLIIGTQRPAKIDLLAISESRNFVVMTLQNMNDRKRLAQEVHPYMIRQVGPLEFWFYKVPERGKKAEIRLIRQVA